MKEKLQANRKRVNGTKFTFGPEGKREFSLHGSRQAILTTEEHIKLFDPSVRV